MSEQPEMLEGIVESFTEAEPLTKGTGYPPGWYQIQVQGRQTPLMLHRNWVVRHRLLKEGDRIRFKISKSGPYGDGATYLEKLEVA